MSSQKVYTALTVYHEGRGESLEGQIAIAHVIFNRAEQRKISAQEVVFQRKQFSCYNEGKPIITNYHALVLAFEAVDRCLEERLHGNTLQGAAHYLNVPLTRKIRGGTLPKWYYKMRKVAVIGKHTFLK